VGRQERRGRFRVLLGPRNPHRERLDSPQEQPGVERGQDRPDRLLGEVDLLSENRVGDDHGAADQVVVTAEELGGAVDHDVGPQRERLLQERRHEGVVHDRQDPAVLGDPRHLADVRDLHQRVGGGLDKQGLGLLSDLFRHRGRVAHVGVIEGKAIGAKQLLEEAVGSTVQVVGAQNVIA
jgi:hypothetical protein